MKSATNSPTNPNFHSTQKPSTLSPSWFASDPSKAYYEKLSLTWAPLSMLALLGGVFATPLYKHCDRNSYLLIAVLACLPGVFIPLLFPCKADRARPLSQRFWLKASVWIAIFGFYGNYFWTHYFYQLLGAEYLFDSYRLNDVPLVTYIATFFYFTFYFNCVNLILRRVARFTADLPPFSRNLLWYANICAFAYGTAVFEAVSIQHFPLYTYKERDSFLLIGSVVYGLYFVVGFPMFFQLDEYYSRTKSTAVTRVSLHHTILNAFAATAIVTLMLDLWRLLLGNIYELGAQDVIPIPFIYQKKGCEVPEQSVPPVVQEFDVSGCAKLASECASAARSWAYRKFSSVVVELQGQTEKAGEAVGVLQGSS